MSAPANQRRESDACFAEKAGADAVMNDTALVAGAVAILGAAAAIVAVFGPNVYSFVFVAPFVQPNVTNDRGPFDRKVILIHFKQFVLVNVAF